MKVIDLEEHVDAIKNSIGIMENFQQSVQNILDAFYSHLKLKALDTYLRPYIHPQLTVCVFREKDWKSAKSNNIIFAIHVEEFRHGQLKYIIEERIKGYKNG